MKADSVNKSDQKLQSIIGFKFKSKIQKEKFILEAYFFDGKLQYSGELPINPYINFNKITQLLQNNQLQIISQNPTQLKIKISFLNVQMFTPSYQQDCFKNFKIQKENLLTENKSLKDKLIQQEKKYQNTIEELKQNYQQKIYKIQTLIKKHQNDKEIMQKNVAPCQINQIKKQVDFDMTPFGLPNTQFRWSKYYSTKNVHINGKFAEIRSSFQHHNTILETGFSKEIKKKQLWGIKIKKQQESTKIEGQIYLGIFLMESIIKQNNLVLEKLGHCQYIITQQGLCYSHSQENFNNVKKSFQFAFGDVIYLEYDPIQWKLRFQRNEHGFKFQMPIIPTPDHDQYYPFVGLKKFTNQGIKIQLELVLPGRLLS